ncbi:MAG: hypothetical protein NTW32_21950 [Chloroflexi bacterium]|nr:hypothetical protein [Chloroflexota bacterium]
MLTSLHGVYRKGKIEIEKPPREIQDETPVIVTFLTENDIDLRERGIDKKQAKILLDQLATFGEDWNAPEMSLYDNYDAARRKP